MARCFDCDGCAAAQVTVILLLGTHLGSGPIRGAL
jgi:hypothetical protein